MLLLIPDEWVLPGPTLDSMLGSVLNAMIGHIYSEKLEENYKFRVLPKPEGFPWPGQLIDFITPHEEQNELVVAFHSSESDQVIPKAMIVLGHSTFRGAKLQMARRKISADGTEVQIPETWFCALKVRGLAMAAWTLNKMYENPNDKPNFVH